MLADYYMLSGGRLVLDSITVQDVVIGFLIIFVLAGVGFYFKGVWGAIWAVAIGVLAFLFWNQISLF